MTSSSPFGDLAAAEASLPQEAPIRRLLIQSLNAAPFARGLGRVREAFVTLQVGSAYQSYGLQLLSPLGRAMLAAALAVEAGLDVRETEAWLEDLAYALVEDFHILRMVDGEPDWDVLEGELLRSIARRVFCGESGDGRGLALDIWPAWLLEEVRALKHRLLARSEAVPPALGEGALRALARLLPFAESTAGRLVHAVSDTCGRLLDDPLRVIGWRICYFAKAAAGAPWELVVRQEHDGTELAAHRLAGLLALLSPDSPELVGQMPERPISCADLGRLLQREDGTLDTAFFRRWMALPAEENALAQGLAKLVEEGRRSGLLFSVSERARNRRAEVEKVGLTTLALRVLKPFQAEIDVVRTRDGADASEGSLAGAPASQLAR